MQGRIGGARGFDATTARAAVILLFAACGGPAPLSPDAGTVADSGVIDSGAVDAGALDAGALDDSGALADGGDVCAPVRLEPAGADRLFLIDVSASWSRRADRFGGARDAVIAAATDSPHAYSLALFPRLDEGLASCDPSDYETLELGWDASATEIETHLDAVTFAGESSLGPALEGAITAARERAGEMPDRTTSIVLVTDATPGDDETCGSWEEIAAIAADGFADGGPESVQVHVISVMGTAISGDHFGRLGAIAGAGGGFAAFVNGGREGVAAATGDAFETLDGRVSTCSMRLPGGLLPARLSYAFAAGAEVALDRVPDASHCTAGGANFYVDDESAPRIATACSGEAGVGGVCEMLLVRARTEGAPVVHATACGL